MVVLLVDDDEDQRVLVEDILGEIPDQHFELRWEPGFEGGLAALAREDVDACLLDYRLGARNGLDLLEEAATLAARPPIILLTGESGREVDLRAMELGADDYLEKARLDAPTLERALRYARERRRATEQLRVSEERYSTALRGAKDCIWDWDLLSGEAFFSERFCTMLGLAPRELRGRSDDWLDRVHSADLQRVRDQFQDHLRGDSPHLECEHRVLHSSGEYRVVLARGVAVRDDEGVPRRVAGSLTDVTDRKTSEENLISHVSHELRSPVHAANMFLSIVCDGLAGELGEQQAELLGRARRNLDQLGSMVGDLLESSRISEGRLEISPRLQPVAPVLDLAMDAVRGRAADKGVELLTAIAPGLPDLCADPGRLRQVVANLLDNAVKFTSGGGRVSLSADLDEGAEDVVVTVSDTGCGMGEEACQAVFERLHQERSTAAGSRQGLGLGLFICRQVVEAHGGRIWAESQPGAGSSFRFTVPVFDLARVLADLWQEQPVEAGEACLLELRAPGLQALGRGPVHESACEDTRAVLRRGLSPPGAALLPPMVPPGDEPRFHILLLASREDSRRLATRLVERLAGAPELGHVDLGWQWELQELGHAGGQGRAGEQFRRELAARMARYLPAGAGPAALLPPPITQ